MALEDAYLQDLKTRLTPLGGVVSKRMFGGAGLFLDGLMFAKVAPSGTVAFKADETNRAEFETLGMRKSGKMPYHDATAEQMEDDDALVAAGRSAVAAARRQDTS